MHRPSMLLQYYNFVVRSPHKWRAVRGDGRVEERGIVSPRGKNRPAKKKDRRKDVLHKKKILRFVGHTPPLPAFRTG